MALYSSSLCFFAIDKLCSRVHNVLQIRLTKRTIKEERTLMMNIHGVHFLNALMLFIWTFFTLIPQLYTTLFSTLYINPVPNPGINNNNT